ncbi:hypothetical protein H6F75_03060 [Nodosilinea sp. FACHB-131]|uniref:hypothetical protein n=1 Tax=Cyanophyceae TaxID=3028117 RepID=UPI00168377D2|nr:hypothetical protein [Nodosilinea sp. FACHB-131]MBD1872451.1 hypothetical protein [Nodosilinea sp. FACHB-131]
MADELKANDIYTATVTISGAIASRTKFAPNAIAEVYWQLHTQAPDHWQTEHIYQ